MGDFLRWPCKLSIVLCQLFLDKCSVLHNGDIPRNRMYAYKADVTKPLTCSQFISVVLVPYYTTPFKLYRNARFRL